MTLLVRPHDFELAVSGDVLRSSCCPALRILVSCNGEAEFFDSDNQRIAYAEKTDETYSEARIGWKTDFLTVQFGRMITIDNYPNCDGEYDRWDTVWSVERAVTLNLEDRTLSVL